MKLEKAMFNLNELDLQNQSTMQSKQNSSHLESASSFKSSLKTLKKQTEEGKSVKGLGLIKVI